jgi:hypothetical protein
MLVTFKSKALTDVMMYQEHAKRILDLLGKDVRQGVITADEIGNAVTTLEAEITQSRTQAAAEDVRHDMQADRGEFSDDSQPSAAAPVSFAARAHPFLEMLRAAKKRNQAVAWGI